MWHKSSGIKFTDGTDVKNVTFELKSTGDSGSGTFEGIMSAPVLDRDHEIVDTRAFDPLPEHITIDIDHGLTVEKTVGSGEPYYDTDGLLKVKGKFASTPLGQVTRTLVKEGHIRHMSVAFRDALREVDEKTGITHIRKGELINCTITGIPANMATAVIAKVGARNAAKDLERLQATHDHMVELGATCGEKHVRFAGPGEGDIVAVITDVKSTETEPPATGPAEAAPDAGAEVDVARARTRAKLLLARANLALE